jgi:hypothetical protein
VEATLKHRLKEFLYLLLRTIGVIGVLVILAFGALLYTIGSGCRNELGLEVLQPNGKWKAVSFQRDCGATTGFSTQISIIPANTKLKNKAGNVFTMDSNHGQASLRVDMEWVDTNTLQIAYPKRARVFSKKERFKNVAIQYITLEDLVEREYRSR